jgi:hypothetical protein
MKVCGKINKKSNINIETEEGRQQLIEKILNDEEKKVKNE